MVWIHDDGRGGESDCIALVIWNGVFYVSTRGDDRRRGACVCHDHVCRMYASLLRSPYGGVLFRCCPWMICDLCRRLRGVESFDLWCFSYLFGRRDVCHEGFQSVFHVLSSSSVYAFLPLLDQMVILILGGGPRCGLRLLL